MVDSPSISAFISRIFNFSRNKTKENSLASSTHSTYYTLNHIYFVPVLNKIFDLSIDNMI